MRGYRLLLKSVQRSASQLSSVRSLLGHRPEHSLGFLTWYDDFRSQNIEATKLNDALRAVIYCAWHRLQARPWLTEPADGAPGERKRASAMLTLS